MLVSVGGEHFGDGGYLRGTELYSPHIHLWKPYTPVCFHLVRRLLKLRLSEII